MIKNLGKKPRPGKETKTGEGGTGKRGRNRSFTCCGGQRKRRRRRRTAPAISSSVFWVLRRRRERERDPKKEIHGLPSSFLPFPCKTTTPGFALAVFILVVISWESAIGQERVSPPLAFLRSGQGRSKNGSLKEKRDEVRRKMRQKRVFPLSTRQGINYCLAEGKKKPFPLRFFLTCAKERKGLSHEEGDEVCNFPV